MKIVTAFAAAMLGACLFAGGAEAAPITPADPLAQVAGASTLATPVACKTVVRRVCLKGRGCHTTRRSICTRPERRVCRSVTRRSCYTRGGRRVCTVVKRRSCH